MKELNLANDLKLCNQTSSLYFIYKKKSMYKYFQQNFLLPYIMMNSRLSDLMVIQCTMQTLFAWSVILWRRKYE